jgi:hypothetical protein
MFQAADFIARTTTRKERYHRQFVKEHTRKYFPAGQTTTSPRTPNDNNVDDVAAAHVRAKSDQEALATSQIRIDEENICIICLEGSTDRAPLCQIVSSNARSKTKTSTNITSWIKIGTVLPAHTAQKDSSIPENGPVLKKNHFFKKKLSSKKNRIFNQYKTETCNAVSPHLSHRECIKLSWFYTPTKKSIKQTDVRANTCPICFYEVFKMKDGESRKPKCEKFVIGILKSPFYAAMIVLALGFLTLAGSAWLLLGAGKGMAWVYRKVLEKVRRPSGHFFADVINLTTG